MLPTFASFSPPKVLSPFALPIGKGRLSRKVFRKAKFAELLSQRLKTKGLKAGVKGSKAMGGCLSHNSKAACSLSNYSAPKHGAKTLSSELGFISTNKTLKSLLLANELFI